MTNRTSRTTRTAGIAGTTAVATARRLAAAAVLLALGLAVPARAFDVEPAPLEPAARPVPPAPAADGAFSAGIWGGADGDGMGLGFLLGVGHGVSDDLRLDLALTVGGFFSSEGAWDVTTGRATAELRLGKRTGTLRPWAGAGIQFANVSAELAGDPTTVCFIGQPLCVDGTVGGQDAEGESSGPVISAGLTFAATERLLLGLEVHHAFLPAVKLDPLPERAVGGTSFLFGLTWRSGQ